MISEVAKLRKQKLIDLKEKSNAFPNTFKRDDFSKDLIEKYGDFDREEYEAKNIQAKVAGRIKFKRNMGKASFVQIDDPKGSIQLYVTKQDLGADAYAQFTNLDLGDIIGCSGVLFKTRTLELTIHAKDLLTLVKSILPLPDKHSGLVDQETRYRRRYLDLISNPSSKEVFVKRSKAITFIRDFLNKNEFLEVETPMMHSIPGGASAKPFVTHHNALGEDLFLRIAPELYLKKLVVGGFEKVYELNRNFRNEGVSTRHNPEFTMVEFYQAYSTYEDLISLTKSLLSKLCLFLNNTYEVDFQENKINFEIFTIITLKKTVLEELSISSDDYEDLAFVNNLLKQRNLEGFDSLGVAQYALFENFVEHKLIQPTFVTEFPIEVSPLARRNDMNPLIADRFELFIAGQEIANGFSELNDPIDQENRFKLQAKLKDEGDDEAMYFDQEYINALEQGLPPTAGEGIGIDRLVMLLTNSSSIKDVLLFPSMKSINNQD